MPVMRKTKDVNVCRVDKDDYCWSGNAAVVSQVDHANRLV
jgi:hypothetical protein